MPNDCQFQVLLDKGCIYQERHGWERPGWFVPDAVPEVIKTLSSSAFYYLFSNDLGSVTVFFSMLEATVLMCIDLKKLPPKVSVNISFGNSKV